MPKLATHVELPDSGSTDREFDNVYRELAAKATSGATITSGAGAPSSTPTTVGDVYLDETATREYRAYGTSSSADWIKLPMFYSTTFTISAGSGNKTIPLPSDWSGGIAKIIISAASGNYYASTSTYEMNSSYDALTSSGYTNTQQEYLNTSDQNGVMDKNVAAPTGNFISATSKTIVLKDGGATRYCKLFVWA